MPRTGRPRMPTPSQRNSSAVGIGVPSSWTGPARSSPRIHTVDFSTLTSCPVSRSHPSLATMVRYSASSPGATTSVSSANPRR